MKKLTRQDQENIRDFDKTIDKGIQPWEAKPILCQKNLNSEDIISNNQVKKGRSRKFNNQFIRAKLSKKSENCMIDKQSAFINFISPKHEEQAKEVSHIQILKKQIQFLDQEKAGKCKWQKYPRPQAIKIAFNEEPRPKTSDIKLHSIQRFMRENHPSFIIQGLANTFSDTFSTNPYKLRPTSCQQRVLKSLKRKSNITSLKTAKYTPEKGDQLFKAIHTKIQILAPFKKYFHSNRKKRNHSQISKVGQIQGRGILKLSDYCNQVFVSI